MQQHGEVELSALGLGKKFSFCGFFFSIKIAVKQNAVDFSEKFLSSMLVSLIISIVNHRSTFEIS